MSKQITLIQASVAALLLAVASSQSAQAAPQEVVKLPRVVITGKAAPQITKLEQLPRVVVTGLSINTLIQQQMLAAAKSGRRAL
ncbi:hypothetical protein BH11PSE10_BH11PSE10_07290 [soil metagenome]